MTEAKKVVRLAPKPVAVKPVPVPPEAGEGVKTPVAPVVPGPVIAPPPASAPVVAPAPKISPAPALAPAPAAILQPAAGLATGTGIIAVPIPEGTCPKCGKVMSLGSAVPLSDTTCSSCGARFMVPGRLDGFTLVGRIGAGEMGEIYRARDESLDREVAIKVVLADRSEESTLHERLSREARAAARLSHPHVAQVHALGFSNGHPYLVMELVRGEDMDVLLRKNGHVEERIAMRAVAEVTEGLIALHREGLTHGDIKPGNIILDREGSSKLVDFGLSGMSRRDGSKSIVGTPQYIAPETLRGSPDTPQTDIYSLGATLYHLLAGIPPFDGPTPAEVARARLVKPADPISKHVQRLSPGTQRIVMKMLEADPARRYKDCTALLADLREVRRVLESPLPTLPRNMGPGLSPGLGPSLSPGMGAGLPHTAGSVIGQGVGHGSPSAVASTGTPAPAAVMSPTEPVAGGTVVESLKSSLKAAAKVEPPPLPDPEPVELPKQSTGKGLKRVFGLLALMILAGGMAVLYLKRASVLEQLGFETDRDVAPPVELVEPAKPATQAPALISLLPSDPSAAEPPVTKPAVEVKPVHKTFPRVLSPNWVTSGFGQSGRGTTFWHKGTLLLQGEGFDTAQSRDIFRFCYAPVSEEFALSVKLVTAAKTHAMAKTGLLIGENTGELGQNLFFGKMGDGSLIFQMRQAGEMDRVIRVSDGPVALPCYLRISRWGNEFEAATSIDGVRWTSFGECTLTVPAVMYGGVAVSAGVAGVVAMAEFRDLSLRVPNPVADAAVKN